MTLGARWRGMNFTPNPVQKGVIRHVSGPLYLPVGPDFGKTRARA